MAGKTTHFSLRLDPKLKAAAEKAAAEDHRSLSSLTKVLLDRHCREREGDTQARPLSKRISK